ARVLPLFTQDSDEQVGSAVEHFRRVLPLRRAGNVALNAHEMGEPIKAAERGLDLSQDIERGKLGCGVALLLRQFRSHLSYILQFSVFKRQLSGNKQQVSRANDGRIIADGFWRCREFQSELLKLQRNVHRRWSFLVALLLDGSERDSVFSFAQ